MENVNVKKFELENGFYPSETIQDQINLATILMQNNLVSESFKSASQVVTAIQLCKAYNLNPIIGLKQMYVVGGKPTIYGDLPLSLVKSSGLLEYHEEFFIDETGKRISIENENILKKVFGAVCSMKRKGEHCTQTDFYTEQDRIDSGSNSIVWNKHKRLMFRSKARIMCLKSKFADILNGFDIAEYTYNDLPQYGIIENQESKLEKLNDKFGDKND